jgi:hypothetical protein
MTSGKAGFKAPLPSEVALKALTVCGGKGGVGVDDFTDKSEHLVGV